MTRDLRWSAPAALIALGCAVVVVVRAAGAPPPPAGGRLAPDEVESVAAEVAAREPGWASEAARAFPGDRWSQRDDFHGREYRLVEGVARERGVAIEEVLGAIDDDLHRPRAAASDRVADAVPCKPRPFYD